MADVSIIPPPPHFDAPWVNRPILVTSGPLQGKWIRAQLDVQQQPRRGRKGAIHDLRPLHPPPTVRLRLFEVEHPVPRWMPIPGSSPPTLQFQEEPELPPPDAKEVSITITARLTTHFLCFASLFKVHPPTREREYGRVDRKILVGPVDASGAPVDPQLGTRNPATTVIERPKSDKSRSWRSIRAHPMTAISCQDPSWQSAVNAAWARFHQEGKVSNPPQALDSTQEQSRGTATVVGDLSLPEMMVLERYLPREPPKWVIPYADVTSQLSKRETAGHLIPSCENGEPALYFVFSDLAIRTEGYFALRFHVINLDWHVDPRFTRQGPALYAPLADCVTDTFAVYSTKEFPGLPPTTEFTSYLVRQGVRIRFREDRPADTALGSEGRTRPPRKNSKSAAATSPDGIDDFAQQTPPSLPPMNTYGEESARNESWSPQILQVAAEVYKNNHRPSIFGPLSVHEDADEPQASPTAEHHTQTGHPYPPQNPSPVSHQFVPQGRRTYPLVANMAAGLTLQDSYQTSPTEYSSIHPNSSPSTYPREAAIPTNVSPLGYAHYTETGYPQLPPINIPPSNGAHWRDQDRTDPRSAEALSSPVDRPGHRYTPYPPSGHPFDKMPSY